MTDKAERFSRDLKQKGVRVRVGHGGYRVFTRVSAIAGRT